MSQGAELNAELQAYLERTLIGQASTPMLRQAVPLMAREHIARYVGVPVGRVRLLNPRWEDGGRSFLVDGIELDL